MDVAHIDLASVDHVLTSTRAVRRRLDLTRAIEPGIIERCIEIALQAPSGLYGETAHFVVAENAGKRKALAAIMRRAGEGLLSGEFPFDPFLAGIWSENPADRRFSRQQRLLSDGAYLAGRLHEIPALIFPCVEGRAENSGPGAQASLYGSIMPATWSLMLALRARGVGSVMVTFWIHHFEREVARLLGIPESVTIAAMIPVAYFTGADFKPAKRAPAFERTHWNKWGGEQSI
jgi:nitroreductase